MFGGRGWGGGVGAGGVSAARLAAGSFLSFWHPLRPAACRLPPAACHLRRGFSRGEAPQTLVSNTPPPHRAQFGGRAAARGPGRTGQTAARAPGGGGGSGGFVCIRPAMPRPPPCAQPPSPVPQTAAARLPPGPAPVPPHLRRGVVGHEARALGLVPGVIGWVRRVGWVGQGPSTRTRSRRAPRCPRPTPPHPTPPHPTPPHPTPPHPKALNPPHLASRYSLMMEASARWVGPSSCGGGGGVEGLRGEWLVGGWVGGVSWCRGDKGSQGVAEGEGSQPQTRPPRAGKAHGGRPWRQRSGPARFSAPPPGPRQGAAAGSVQAAGPTYLVAVFNPQPPPHLPHPPPLPHLGAHPAPLPLPPPWAPRPPGAARAPARP
jgi:hypothetical protein